MNPPCPRCGSTRNDWKITLRPASDTHYANRLCPECGCHRGFEPRPAVDPIELTLPINETGRLALLVGSEAQVSYALSFRKRKLDEWSKFLPPDMIEALKTITDATWWIANKDKPYDAIKWPKNWSKAQ